MRQVVELLGVKEIYSIFPDKIKRIFMSLNINEAKLEEIRFRCMRPVTIRYNAREYFVGECGGLSDRSDNAFVITSQMIGEILSYASNYSIYAHEEDLRNGFITIRGGHRIGLAGRIVMENEKIKTIKNISYMNIRVSHEVRGCADKILPYIIKGNDNNIYHTLIISPPGCGKTTLLRDIIRQVSDGNETFHGLNVGVVDERSEIGASYMGNAQNDIGMRTDVLDCCPKSLGMMMMVRSMSPKVVAVDEIGSIDDVNALEYITKCGCRIIATVHGGGIDDILQKPVLGKLVRNRVFQRYIILSNRIKAGFVEGIFDDRGTSLYASGQVS